VVLAIDASMRPDFFSLKRKMDRNISKITGNKSTEIKYFESQIDETKGTLDMIVPVVVGIEGANADALIKDISQLINLKKITEKNEDIKLKIKNKLKEIENHPSQIVFLQEIICQLEKYQQLFEEKDDEKSINYKKQIGNILGIIKKVLETKKDINIGELEEDEVFTMIKSMV